MLLLIYFSLPEIISFFKGGTGDLSRTGSVAGGLGGIVSGGFLKLGYIPVSQVYIDTCIYKQTSIFINRKDKTNCYILFAGCESM